MPFFIFIDFGMLQWDTDWQRKVRLIAEALNVINLYLLVESNTHDTDETHFRFMFMYIRFVYVFLYMFIVYERNSQSSLTQQNTLIYNFQ